MGAYPSKDMVRQAADGAAKAGEGTEAPAPASVAAAYRAEGKPCALIAAVEPDSPAYDAGFEPGCYLTSVDGHPLRDLIDWRWLATDDVMEVGYIDLDGEEGVVELEREEGEDWGFAFEGAVFDEIKLCRNACTFCFMRQLPPGVRPSLVLRDDDFRLSFLSGTFVTLTNLSAEDEARILEQRISPLRVSLHASDPEVRRMMIGRHAQHGLDALDRLLAAGIEVHAQIVLVPGQNDGEALRRTLAWAYARPGILNIGIVPLGFTKHQTAFTRSFNDTEDARAVLEVIEPFQRRALEERDMPWVFAADEFYRNAYREETVENLPPTSHYGDFSMFEDGIGIIRSYVDEFAQACAGGLAQQAAEALAQANVRVRFVVGEAMQPFLDRMLARSPLAGRLVPLTVKNAYFGGNVDVTGLLCGCDIARAINEAIKDGEEDRGTRLCDAGSKGLEARSAARGAAPAALFDTLACAENADQPAAPSDLFVIPSVILNDDQVTLDDMTVMDVERAAGAPVAVVSCNPLDYLVEIINMVQAR